MSVASSPTRRITWSPGRGHVPVERGKRFAPIGQPGQLVGEGAAFQFATDIGFALHRIPQGERCPAPQGEQEQRRGAQHVFVPLRGIRPTLAGRVRATSRSRSACSKRVRSARIVSIARLPSPSRIRATVTAVRIRSNIPSRCGGQWLASRRPPWSVRCKAVASHGGRF